MLLLHILLGLSTGYPIYIYDTRIGSGVTSIDNSNSAVVGIGTTFLDNVYYVSAWSNDNTGDGPKIGIITCNVDSNSNIVGPWNYWKYIKSSWKIFMGKIFWRNKICKPNINRSYWKYCIWIDNISGQFREEVLVLEKLEHYLKGKHN